MSGDESKSSRAPGSRVTPVAWFLLAVAVVLFVRGVTRVQLWDFAVISTAARAWAVGHDPYDQAYLNNWWAEHAAASGLTTDVSWLPQVVPPTTQVVMAPFALFSVGSARWAWLVFVIVGVGAQIASLVALSGTRGTRRALLVAYVLAMGPTQLGMISGQPALPGVAMMITAVWAASRGRDRTAAVLLGIASALKMQLGLPFIVLYAYLRRWRVAAGSTATLVAIGAIAVLRLELAHVPDWRRHWQENLAPALASGGVNDFSQANPTRWHLINLQVLVNVFVPDRTLTFVVTWLALALAAGIFVRVTWPRSWSAAPPDPHRELWYAAFAAPLTLMPVYHRYYDATLMALTMAWALAEWDANDPRVRRSARAAALVLLSLLVPLAAAPPRAIDLGYLPKWLDANFVWNATMTSQQAWVLLLALIATLMAVVAEYGRSSKAAAPIPSR